MRDVSRADLTARAWVTLLALLPYWPLLTLGVVYITDDFFASDIYNGELPGRVLIGEMIRGGALPFWTSNLCSGLPLAGAPLDAITLAAFSLLPPAPALDLFVLVLLLVAAHGSYSLARRLDASRAGAVLAGMAFAGSGYIACQLKHLAIVSTVVWLPVGLLLIDRFFDSDRSNAEDSRGGLRRAFTARRVRTLALLGLTFGQQVLSGFPQSAYICALAYGSFSLWRAAMASREARTGTFALGMLGGLAIAMIAGAAAGAVVLLPLAELGGLSLRAETEGWEWSTSLAYWPRNAWTFLFPYINGDISDNTYIGPPFFWEDYGYVGIGTFLLAIYGAVRERRRPLVLFVLILTVLAYLLVLGRATPVYRVFYTIVPGLQQFRFPTRFLIVVELGLALLGAVGLTRLTMDVERWVPARKRLPQAVALLLVAGTAVDLFVHQPRQNPMVSAREWLAPPSTVAVVHGDNGGTDSGASLPRTYTPRHDDLHRRAFDRARGWQDVGPYYDLRELLQPNTGGGFWNTPSADCYAGVAPRWHVQVWGDHDHRDSLVGRLSAIDFERNALIVDPALPPLLGAYGITHLLSPYPQVGANLPMVDGGGATFVYRIDQAARVRYVPSAIAVQSDQEAMHRLVDGAFDPGREVLLHEVTDVAPPATDAARAAGRALVRRDTARELVIDVDAPAEGFLLVADTFYPGWTARVDGRPAPLYRANVSVRAVAVPRGRHEVTMNFEGPAFVRGLRLSVVAIFALLLCAGGATYVERRSRR